jgi:ribosomal protein S8
MSSNRRSAHERSNIAVYVKFQRRQALNIVNASSNLFQRIVNLDASKSKLNIIFIIFTSSFFSDCAFFNDKTFDDKIIITDRKTIKKKYVVKKKSRINKRRMIYKVNKYFYNKSL